MSVMQRMLGVLLVVALVAGVGAIEGSAATPGQIAHANRRAAEAAASQVLGEVVLPVGATEVSAEPGGDDHDLARPVELSLFAAEVDRHAFWTTTTSPGLVIASMQAHLPAGARTSVSGTSGSDMSVSYTLPIVDPPALGPRTLEVDAVELADGSTGVRADAIVRYSAPRLPAQRVPLQARVLEITKANFRSKPSLSLTVIRRSRVRRIAELVDGLPFIADLNGVAIACGVIGPAPIDTFTFRAAPTGRVLARVTEAADTPTGPYPCTSTALTIRGHREPELLEGGTLLRRADAVLGVRLTS